MDLFGEISAMHKNHKQSVKDTLDWYKNAYKDKTIPDVYAYDKLERSIIGKFLKFNYSPANKADLEFYDKTPLILCIDSHKYENSPLCLRGINMNFFPYEIKAYIVSTLAKKYYSKIEYQMKIKPRDARMQKGLQLTQEEIRDVLIKVNTSFSSRNYFTNKIENLSSISFENLYRIPFLEEHNFVRTNVKKLRKTYYQTVKGKK